MEWTFLFCILVRVSCLVVGANLMKVSISTHSCHEKGMSPPDTGKHQSRRVLEEEMRVLREPALSIAEIC